MMLDEPVAHYYESADGMVGSELLLELSSIIANHTNRGYGEIWNFFEDYERDLYYEKDHSLLDIYSEVPDDVDPYVYYTNEHQCGNYIQEGDCYNREHSLPKSWYGDAEPMHSDIHHIFATDGFVNAVRGNYIYGEVGDPDYVTLNGCRFGNSTNMGYWQLAFEPIDEFKGDLARAYLYMGVRYLDVVPMWEGLSVNGDSVFNYNNIQVWHDTYLRLLLQWHEQDPVSEKERVRNDAAFKYQNNRNPFVDRPYYANDIYNFNKLF